MVTRNRVEAIFERLAGISHDHAGTVLFVNILLLAFFLCQLPKLTIDTSPEALLHQNDPTLLDYNRFLDEFGRTELVIIAVKTPDVFQPNVIEKLRKLHRELEAEVPYVRKVSSLINARSVRASGDDIIIESLLGEEHSLESLAIVKERALNNPLYMDNLLTADGRITALIVETEGVISDNSENGSLPDMNAFNDSDELKREDSQPGHYFHGKENAEVAAAIRRITNRYGGPDFEIALSGGPFVFDVLNNAVNRDMVAGLSYCFITVIFFLSVLFRRISGVIWPLLIIVASMISTMGILSLFGISIKMTTMVVPAFLVVVGVGDSVHILAIFFRHIENGSLQREAMIKAIGHSGLAVLMTSLTTAVGLLSFSFSELTAIGEMGIFGASGVMLAWYSTIVLLPAFSALFPVRKKENNQKHTLFMDRVLNGITNFSMKRSKSICIVSLGIFLATGIFLFTLRVSINVLNYFPDNATVRNDLEFIDKALGGTMTLELVVDTKRKNGILDPELLRRIGQISRAVKGLRVEGIKIGKVLSINDSIKEINRVLHGDDPGWYRIPGKKEAVAQELLLLETSRPQDLERIVDGAYSKTRITVKATWADAVDYQALFEKIEKKAIPIMKGIAEVTLTGGMPLMARTIPAALDSMAESYITAFLVITCMMIILVGNIRLGLISMIPNLLPISTVMGIIGFLGVGLDFNTLMIGSIAMGLVVDDTMHFMYNFRKYYNMTNDTETSVRETLLGTGRAMLITSLVLWFGFTTLMFGELKSSYRFGLFTGMTIILALIADFFVAPALLNLMKKQPVKNL